MFGKVVMKRAIVMVEKIYDMLRKFIVAFVEFFKSVDERLRYGCLVLVFDSCQSSDINIRRLRLGGI